MKLSEGMNHPEIIAPKERIILALDVDNAFQALQIVQKLNGHVGAFKVGLELVNAAGIGILEKLRDAGADRIFYDCKLHDIPNTVGGAMKAIARHGLWMTNLHASGGKRMIAAAVKALNESSLEAGVAPPILLGVTLLTSLTEEELHTELLVPQGASDYVVSMAKLVQEAGGNGVVSSPHEIEAVRAVCGPGFKIVTPGVRPKGVDAGDQRRTMTPREAVARGADYLVIGRAISGAEDPVAATSAIAQEIASALL